MERLSAFFESRDEKKIVFTYFLKGTLALIAKT